MKAERFAVAVLVVAGIAAGYLISASRHHGHSHPHVSAAAESAAARWQPELVTAWQAMTQRSVDLDVEYQMLVEDLTSTSDPGPFTSNSDVVTVADVDAARRSSLASAIAVRRLRAKVDAQAAAIAEAFLGERADATTLSYMTARAFLANVANQLGALPKDARLIDRTIGTLT